MAADPVLHPQPQPTTSRLRVEGISKTFGRNRALRSARLDVQPGEIHALIGQNGSGKSTLAKVLTGYHAPDPGGRVLVDGTPLRLPVRPVEARGRGVAVVHQNLGLVAEHTVLENLRVGRFRPRRFSRRIEWHHERERAAEVLGRMHRAVPLQARVGELPEEDRATVAIARALQDARDGQGLIIFDESTRALSRQTLEHFYAIIDDVVAAGTAVLLITHRLEEVIAVADRVTVLRDGCCVETGLATDGLDELDLARVVLGRELSAPSGRRDAEARSAGPAAVEVRGASGEIAVDVELSIMPGEVLGVTGLTGSGHDELPYLVAGARPARTGTVTVSGRTVSLPGLSPAEAMRAGIALVPEGREVAGLAMDASVAENLTLPQSSCRTPALRPTDRRAERAVVTDWLTRLDVRPPAPDLLVGKLSGGNQQKVLLGKWLATAPALLVLHEPTQAVDVGARQTIIAAIRAAAASGCTVLVAGSDENELALLCDRVLVFRDGRIADELTGPLTPDAIVGAITVGARASARRARPAHRTP